MNNYSQDELDKHYKEYKEHLKEIFKANLTLYQSQIAKMAEIFSLGATATLAYIITQIEKQVIIYKCLTIAMPTILALTILIVSYLISNKTIGHINSKISEIILIKGIISPNYQSHIKKYAETLSKVTSHLNKLFAFSVIFSIFNCILVKYNFINQAVIYSSIIIFLQILTSLYIFCLYQQKNLIVK